MNQKDVKVSSVYSGLVLKRDITTSNFTKSGVNHLNKVFSSDKDIVAINLEKVGETVILIKDLNFKEALKFNLNAALKLPEKPTKKVLSVKLGMNESYFSSKLNKSGAHLTFSVEEIANIAVILGMEVRIVDKVVFFE
jgi:hypothetical protein